MKENLIEMKNKNSSIIENLKISDQWYLLIQSYVKEKGHLNVEENTFYLEKPLGLRVKRMRTAYHQMSNGQKMCILLTPEEIDVYTELGMIWDKEEYNRQEWHRLASKYNELYGHLNPRATEIFEGKKLGRKIQVVRKLYQTQMSGGDLKTYTPLSEEEIRAWEDCNIAWYLESPRWEYAYEQASYFYKRYGHLEVPKEYILNRRISQEKPIDLFEFIEKEKINFLILKKDPQLRERERRLCRIGMNSHKNSTNSKKVQPFSELRNNRDEPKKLQKVLQV